MTTVADDEHLNQEDRDVSLSQVLELLPQLDAEQLEEVRNHLNALESLTAAPSTENDWLLQGVVAELRDRGLGETVPERLRLTNRRQYHGYIDKSARVRKFLEENLPGLTRMERSQLGRLAASCLAEFIAKFRTVSLAGMLQSIDLVPAAVEEAFPDYVRTGSLPALFRGLPRAAGMHQR